MKDAAAKRRQIWTPAVLLGALVLLLMIAPLIEGTPWGRLIEAVLVTLMLLAAALVAGERRISLAWSAALLVPALAGKWAHHIRPDLVGPEWFLLGGMLLVAFATMRLFRFIERAPVVDAQVLCAGVAAYLMLGMLWAFLYTALGTIDPHAFVFTAGPPAGGMEGFTAVYFSFITLCTVGFGDIVPVTGAARMLAMMEAMTGVLYIAMLVARLVSLYRAEPRAPADR